MRPEYTCKPAKVGKVGEPSSKYGYPGGGEQFERDIAQKAWEAKILYEELVEWMMERKVEPEVFRLMYMRFYDEYIDVGRNNK